MSNNVAGVAHTYFRKPTDPPLITFTFPKLLFRENKIHFPSADRLSKVCEVSWVRSLISTAAARPSTTLHVYHVFVTQLVLGDWSELGFQFTSCSVDENKDLAVPTSKAENCFRAAQTTQVPSPLPKVCSLRLEQHCNNPVLSACSGQFLSHFRHQGPLKELISLHKNFAKSISFSERLHTELILLHLPAGCLHISNCLSK